MRIQICGPSGAGKTTTANYIHSLTGFPYVHTSGPELRAKYGCGSHEEVIRMTAMDPQKGLQYQRDLLTERGELSKLPDYVMDRSFIDNVAYFLMQNAAFLSGEETFQFITSALALVPRVDLFIFIPPLYTAVEKDGVRIENMHYQRMTWQIMQYAAIEFFHLSVNSSDPKGGSMEGKPKRLMLNRWDLNWRKDRIKEFLQV